MTKLFICDWGIGGLSLVRAIESLRPLSYRYFSDTGSVPYGKETPTNLKERLQTIASYAASTGASHLLVACNAASTVLPQARAGSAWPKGLTTIDMVTAGLSILRESTATNIAVVGGRRTIESGVFEKPFEGSPKNVITSNAQPLSALIERGDINSQEFNKTVSEIFRPLAHCQEILLACTHYVAAIQTIEKVLPGVRIIDPAPTAVRLLLQTYGLDPDPAVASFLTTGNPEAMAEAAKAAFNMTLDRIESAPLALANN